VPEQKVFPKRKGTQKVEIPYSLPPLSRKTT
jgi:hypothetical protein